MNHTPVVGVEGTTMNADINLTLHVVVAYLAIGSFLYGWTKAWAYSQTQVEFDEHGIAIVILPLFWPIVVMSLVFSVVLIWIYEAWKTFRE